MAQSAFRSIVHNQKGSVVLDAEIKYADDVWMSQAADCLCFVDKALEVVAGDLRVQDFDGCLRLQIDVFSEVDLGEATFPKEADEAVVSELLREGVTHLLSPRYPAFSHEASTKRTSIFQYVNFTVVEL